MANREMQKKVKADRARKQARKSIITKTLIVVLIIAAVGSAILIPILTGNRDKDTGEDSNTPTTTSVDYVVLNLGSTLTCEPCRMIKPVVDGLRSKYQGTIQIKSHDIQNSQEGISLARKYNIYSMPTLIFLYKGEEVHRSEGYRDANQIEAIFSDLGWI